VILQDYDLQKSVNFFDRQSLAKFNDLFAWLALKQKLNSIWIAVTNIGQWTKVWSSDFEWLYS
jgi:hypothetical protein